MQNCSFEVIGTGSDGNCYLLNVGNQTLIIEAGVVFSKIKKALNFDLSKVVGVLISHEHGDHSCSVKDFLKFGKCVFATKGTFEGLKINSLHNVKYLIPFCIGTFKVTPFQTFHDAKEPCGFLIEFEGKRLVFITDTCDIKTRFKNIDYWIIEANYSNKKLESSDLDIRLKKRIQDTHMSIDRCKTILEAHNATNALLIHASNNHADKEEFLQKIPYAVVAENGYKKTLD